jgi:hypothetical protein
MPTNTNFNPRNINEFEKSKLLKNAIGVSTTAAFGTTTNLDLLLTDDVLVTEGVLLARNVAQGDKVSFQILMGEMVLNQFITDWYLNPDSTNQQTPKSSYPAKLPAGLTLRVIYTSVGTEDVWIAVNYNLEKILE